MITRNSSLRRDYDKGIYSDLINNYVIWDMLSEICDFWRSGALGIWGSNIYLILFITLLFFKKGLFSPATEINQKIYIYLWNHMGKLILMKAPHWKFQVFLKKNYFTVCFGNGTIQRKWGRSVMNGRCSNFALWSSRQ